MNCTCNELLILTIKDANILEFCRIRKKYIEIRENTAKKASLWLCYHLLPTISFKLKVAFFQKNQLGIGVWLGKPREMGQKWFLYDFCSENQVIMHHITSFTQCCIKNLGGTMAIAFRSTLLCFWKIWSVTGSIPPSGTWYFFSVQITYYKLLMYACISYHTWPERILRSKSNE